MVRKRRGGGGNGEGGGKVLVRRGLGSALRRERERGEKREGWWRERRDEWS